MNLAIYFGAIICGSVTGYSAWLAGQASAAPLLQMAHYILTGALAAASLCLVGLLVCAVVKPVLGRGE